MNEGFIKTDVLLIKFRVTSSSLSLKFHSILQVLSLNDSTSTQKLVERHLFKYVRKKEKETLFNTGTLAIVTVYYFPFLSESTETKAG